MKTEFCTYNQSLALKELGFDEPCFTFFNRGTTRLNEYGFEGLKMTNSMHKEIKSGHLSAPLYQQAFRWLYRKLDIEKGIMPLDAESQQLLLKELIDKVSSKHLLV